MAKQDIIISIQLKGAVGISNIFYTDGNGGTSRLKL